MKLALMQPYIFPYIGYFQLINCADKFVVLDDVNYINKGWINRNNILINGTAYLFTIPLSGASQNKLINQIEILNDNKWKEKLLKTIRAAYCKALYFEQVNDLVEKVINFNEVNLSKYLRNSIKEVCSFLGIETEIEDTSDVYKSKAKGQERILDICKKDNVTQYINPMGGLELYDKKLFNKNGLELFFLKTGDIRYRQYNNEFVPNLSIIDVMMFNSRVECREHLENYSLT